MKIWLKLAKTLTGSAACGGAGRRIRRSLQDSATRSSTLAHPEGDGFKRLTPHHVADPTVEMRWFGDLVVFRRPPFPGAPRRLPGGCSGASPEAPGGCPEAPGSPEAPGGSPDASWELPKGSRRSPGGSPEAPGDSLCDQRADHHNLVTAKKAVVPGAGKLPSVCAISAQTTTTV